MVLPHRSLEDSTGMVIDAKKFSLGYKISALQQLILQRFQTLTTISSISFAVVGVIISVRSELIQYRNLAFCSVGLLMLVAFISLWLHLCSIRGDIREMVRQIEDLSKTDWGKPLGEKDFKVDWWPEVLFCMLVIGVVLFGLSFFDLSGFVEERL